MNKKIFIPILVIALCTGALYVRAGDMDNKRFFYLPIISKDAVEESRKVPEPPALTEEQAKKAKKDGEAIEKSIPDALLEQTSFDTMDIPFGDNLVFRYIYNTVTGDVQYLSIFQDKNVVYANNFLHNINYIEENKTIPFARFMDLDINENGRSDFVIESYSGGAHCCYETLFFEYNEDGLLRFKTRINSKHTPLQFSNNDGDDAYEIEVTDYTYDYWMVPFSESAKPPVTLDYQNGLYEPVIRPSETTINKDYVIRRAQEISADNEQWKDHTVAPELVRLIIEELIYRGHGDWVLDVINAGWPRDDEGRIDWFRTELEEQLKRSPFWSAVARLNNWTDTPNYAPEPTSMPEPEPAIVGPVKERADIGTPEPEPEEMDNTAKNAQTKGNVSSQVMPQVDEDVPAPEVQTIFVFGKDADKVIAEETQDKINKENKAETIKRLKALIKEKEQKQN